MDEVETSEAVFVTAQGLFMYFEESEVRQLLTAIVERFPGVELMFDAIPRWFSRKTMQGLWKTKHYRVPDMTWSVNRDEIEPLLRGWSPRIASVRWQPYRRFRGFPWALFPLIAKVPELRKGVPSIVQVVSARSETGA
ncbi:hypothetical protein [Thiorhodovibrio winogradskyi]|uniref:hypothetical protein n=1 Tax=Thiorhodovibrio winogradskyi TaxID=77007 RepID=UPI002E2E1850|nr:hypothetical protein [Thiorhodovibrio winogradskyi]